jgi:hypothetical protein
MSGKSKRLEKAFKAAKAWPRHRQDADSELLERMDRLTREEDLFSRHGSGREDLSTNRKAILAELLGAKHFC